MKWAHNEGSPTAAALLSQAELKQLSVIENRIFQDQALSRAWSLVCKIRAARVSHSCSQLGIGTVVDEGKIASSGLGARGR